jgi:hypothetical protein
LALVDLGDSQVRALPREGQADGGADVRPPPVFTTLFAPS